MVCSTRCSCGSVGPAATAASALPAPCSSLPINPSASCRSSPPPVPSSVAPSRRGLERNLVSLDADRRAQLPRTPLGVLQIVAEASVHDAEAADVRLTYRFRFYQDSFFFQPDLQYIIRPGAPAALPTPSWPDFRWGSTSETYTAVYEEGASAMTTGALQTPGETTMAQATTESSTYVIALSSVAAIGGFLFGFDSGVINGAVDALAHAFGTRAATTGFAVASVLVGCAVGAFVAGTVADRYGRRPTMLLNGVLFLISAVASGIASSAAAFIAARLVGGLAIGGASVLAPMYISEVAPAHVRGRLGSL